MAVWPVPAPHTPPRVAGGASLRGRRRLECQQHQVEVAVGRHLAAAGAAEADGGQSAGILSDHALADEVVGQPYELIVQEGGGLRGRPTIARFLGQPSRYFRAAGGERFGEELAGLRGQAVALKRVQAACHQAPIDDRALLVWAMTLDGHEPSSHGLALRSQGSIQ